jgi:tetratricopeptide (TPR) repeat protein
MIASSRADRKVLPRWHSPEVSAQRPDTHSIRVPAPAEDTNLGVDELRRRETEFLDDPTDAHAGDFVGAALLARRPERAVDAAAWLMSSGTSSLLSRRLAQRVLQPPVSDDQEHLAVPADMSGTDREIVGRRIQTLRTRLSDAPRDPMTWAELARQHALAGSEAKALEAMRVAIAQAPSDRYLLRAAARLYHHVGDHGSAYALLRRATRTPTDPWLVAAEIASADLAGRSPYFVKVGRAMVESALPPEHLTELASALGTIELEAGERRRARRLFAKALEAPNDNALAQAEWAATRIALEVEPHLQQSDSWEARAIAAAAARDSARAVIEAWGWFFDQPFATDPPIFGSYHAAKSLDFAEGARFAEQGLAANPNAFMLRNNLAFCLAKLDRVREAEAHLTMLRSQLHGPEQAATFKATQGLIAFRAGDPDTGSRLYREAIGATNDRDSQLLALINFAVESVRADPTSGAAIARQAQDEVRHGIGNVDARGWLRHLPSAAENGERDDQTTGPALEP